MSTLAPLGIKRLEGIHYYVRDLERSRQFYTGKLDFAETWRSSPEIETAGKQRSACFQAANVMVVCSSPIGEGGRASRFLAKHPDGGLHLSAEDQRALVAFLSTLTDEKFLNR